VSVVPGTTNLFVNCGHGPLGWTMCAATGRMAATLVTHGADASQVNPLVDACSLSRFDTPIAGRVYRALAHFADDY
jgi:glycine/D-amino acid oxidase-like deaminating enzyme